jgi:opacity protein-like surface antigen
MRFLITLVAFMLAVASPAFAADGWYIGMDVGVAGGSDMSVTGKDNDHPSKCDRFINPDDSGVTAGECGPNPAGDTWMSQFGSNWGIMAGASAGYKWNHLRFEGEYFYRGHNNLGTDRTTVASDGADAKQLQELSALEAAVDSLTSHTLFANVYYDFHNSSKFTPYIGLGVGMAKVDMAYYSRFARESDPVNISTFKGPALNAKLAGTTSTGRNTFSDTVMGWQAIAGVDYQWTEPISVGLKFRWADLDDFSGDPVAWDQLRSHASNNKRNDMVKYNAMTSDLSFWAMTLSMKYAF